jgi:hypothetical protein
MSLLSIEALMLHKAFCSQARHLCIYDYGRGRLPLKERPHSEVVTRGVKVLLKRLLTAK